jgi:hypothetical protein
VPASNDLLISLSASEPLDERAAAGIVLQGRGRHKIAIIRALPWLMRIELNYQAETFEEAVCQTIVTYLGKGMAPREILDQLIERNFVRYPGDNAFEVVVQRLGEIAGQMHHDHE